VNDRNFGMRKHCDDMHFSISFSFFFLRMISVGSFGILTCFSHYYSQHMITLDVILIFFFYDSILQGHLYIIDVSQSVDLDHPSALEFLNEDCLHVTVGHILMPF
jgi:RIO1 family